MCDLQQEYPRVRLSADVAVFFFHSLLSFNKYQNASHATNRHPRRNGDAFFQVEILALRGKRNVANNRNNRVGVLNVLSIICCFMWLVRDIRSNAHTHCTRSAFNCNSLLHFIS